MKKTVEIDLDLLKDIFFELNFYSCMCSSFKSEKQINTLNKVENLIIDYKVNAIKKGELLIEEI